ncbi:MAG: hydrogenase nickel incorporation protein HypB [Gammaproteobacteria bacterium]
MCGTCGCGTDRPAPVFAPAPQRLLSVPAHVSLLEGNDRQARHVREHLDARGVTAVNLMSSPGAGKTALLECTARAFGAGGRMAAITGDLQTDLDARRLAAAGIAAVQISTGQACHLDARMVHDALHAIDLDGIDLLFIENVGNLVCPAVFDVGAHRDVVLLSAAEGHDKPAKYPGMFRAGDLILLSKIDLLPALGDFDPQLAIDAIRRLGSTAPVLCLSARSGEGTAGWFDWLRATAARGGAGDR